jgi:hypothetical protein
MAGVGISLLEVGKPVVEILLEGLMGSQQIPKAEWQPFPQYSAVFPQSRY